MLKKLSPHIKGYKKLIVLCFFLVVGEVVFELLMPLLMARIVDVGIPNEDLGYMARTGGLMILMAVGAITMGVLNARFSSEVSQGVGASIRGDLYKQIQTFSFTNIDEFSSASLITRMTSDVTQLQNTVMMVLRMLIRAPIMLVCALFIAININLQLSTVIVGAVVLLATLVPFVASKVGKLFAVERKRLDDVNGVVQENLIAIRVVKAFVRENYERGKFKKANDNLTAATLHTGNYVALIMPIMMLVLNCTTVAVIWFGGQFVISDVMTTGQLISFLSYIGQILMSVMMFAMVFVMITRARASVERVLEVFDTAPDIADKPEAETSGRTVTRGKVEFKNVSFRYKTENNSGDGGDAGRNVLDGITFTAEPGEFVGIIGGTGSGKTSLVSLIPRFYDVSGGQVLVDGIDVRGYSQKALRDGIGMVMQQNNLFSGTIKDNLLWGNENATDTELHKAAADAQAHSFIESFPAGYETELGQGGVNVSGGQKQRLCIARAMMKNPPILILDDSTSAVDTATEARIRKSFHENFKNSTILIVAQRISSVRHADKIIVLDDGQVAAIGTHDLLLESCEIYREICISQNEGSVA